MARVRGIWLSVFVFVIPFRDGTGDSERGKDPLKAARGQLVGNSFLNTSVRVMNPVRRPS